MLSIPALISMHNLLKKSDIGILLFRLAIGGLIMFYGVKNLMAGTSNWQFLGSNLTQWGIPFSPVFWGFLAALTQSAGGLCFVLGLFFRPACLLLAFTMLVAVIFHVNNGDSLVGTASPSLLFLIAFVSFLFIGSGSFSIKKD